MAMRFLDDHDRHEALWTLPALEPLLFTLTHDGSVRMRRAAMEAARTVVVRHSSLTASACGRERLCPGYVLLLSMSWVQSMLFESSHIDQRCCWRQVQRQAPGELALVRTLALKGRDGDAQVRAAAHALLAQVRTASACAQLQG